MKNFIFLILLQFNNCKSSEISVSDIEQFKNPDFSNKTEVNEFFERRMKNRPKKALVGNWEILHEDNEFVYYGYPRFKGIFSDTRVIEKVYFVSKEKLNKDFPTYNNLSGIEMRIKIYASISDFLRSKNDKIQFTLTSKDWSAELKPNTIEVKATAHIQNPNTNSQIEKRFELIYNKNDLNLLRMDQK